MSNIGSVSGERLRSFVERLERTEEEITALNGDKKEIYSEAKGAGYDVKVLKEVIRLRRQDPADRREHEALVDTYMRALGDIGTRIATRASARAPAREEPAAPKNAPSDAKPAGESTPQLPASFPGEKSCDEAEGSGEALLGPSNRSDVDQGGRSDPPAAATAAEDDLTDIPAFLKRDANNKLPPKPEAATGTEVF